MTIEQEWQPAASLGVIRRRAEMLAAIRNFMQERAILEVETPVLSHATVTEPHIHSLCTLHRSQNRLQSETLYLHTSPEFCMKRLLAAGSGPIYQITKVFRDEETGKRHEPEFTLLEWYRPGLDYHGLMNEINELLQVLGLAPAGRQTYRAAFQAGAGIDPFLTSIDELQICARKYGWDTCTDNLDELLDFIFSDRVTPQLGIGSPLFVHDYPECQAALAVIRAGQPPVAERFELFFKGMEIANGFTELCDADEQRLRFKRDLQQRSQAGIPEVPIDERFLLALEHGLPPCAGVAIGIDRLLMVLTGATSIEDVLAFPLNRN